MSWPFLEPLDPVVRQRLLARCTRRRYPAGAYVFHAGEAGDTLHLVVSGWIAVQVGGGLGEPVTVSVLGRHELFGELALIHPDHRRTATIQTITRTETLVLRRDDFEELRTSVPSVDRFLVALLVRQVTRLTEQVVELAELPVAARVYRRLLQLGRAFEVEDTKKPILINQSQVASMAGAKLRATNSVLTSAQLDGVVALGRRRIIVLDWAQLRRRAGQVAS